MLEEKRKKLGDKNSVSTDIAHFLCKNTKCKKYSTTMKSLKSFVYHVKGACDPKCGSIKCGFLRCPQFFATYDDQ